ncbi:MAG: NADH-quinone oxidoreductase subunit M [Planctomycetaceae bacterium]|nr:NADH-quinone oxidoreductase subunit M [Planctomycetaceae bacterium]
MLSTLLNLHVILPLAAAAAIALAPQRQARWIATFASLATLGLSLAAAFNFGGWSDGSFEPKADGISWLASMGISLTFAVDSVSLMLILLTTFLTPLAMIGSFTAVQEREKEYYGWFMVLLAAMTAVFMARDAIVFYTAYEFTLVPMYFLIAIFGGAERKAASIKFFLYTFLGSILTLSGVIYIAAQYAKSHGGSWTFDLSTLATFCSTELGADQQYWIFILLMVGFAVKVPFFPVHTWLPLAHDQAPTAGSVILAGTLLKLGTYGVYRVALPAAPVGGVELSQLLAVLCIIGIVNAALICWVQHDAKKLIAYSSVSHLGFCMLGLFSLNSLGATGSVMYMINHGLSTGALFLCIGMIYERYHTKDMDQLGGLFKRMPVWSFFMVFFTLASLGLPGLNGFIGEFLCLMGCFTAEPNSVSGWPGILGPWYAVVAGLGLVLAAMYLLILLGKLVWGPLREPHGESHHGGSHDTHLPADLTPREIGILVPLAAVCLAIGFYPKPMLEAIAPSVEKTLAPYPKLVERFVQDGSLLAPAGKTDGVALAPSTTESPERKTVGF